MWIKFDGTPTKIKIKHDSWKDSQDFVISKWVHLKEDNGNIFINGKKHEERNNEI